MQLNVFNKQKDLKISTRSAKKLIQLFLKTENLAPDSVSVYFVKEKEICELHDQFFDDPSPTDCISFPLDFSKDEGIQVLGEVFVCPKTAINYSHLKQLDPYKETTLYLIHGLLHLIGYEDTEPQMKRKMRRAEARHLKIIEKEGQWLHC